MPLDKVGLQRIIENINSIDVLIEMLKIHLENRKAFHVESLGL